MHIQVRPLEELKTYLLKQNYLLKLIDVAISKVQSIEKTYRVTHEKSEELDIIPYVTTFNPYNPEIYHDIKKLKPILHRNEELHKV